MLIDTNVWSELLRRRPEQRVLDLLSDNRSDLHLSMIVVAEMEYGLAKATDLDQRTMLRQFIDDIVISCDDRIMQPDLAMGKVFGEIRARLRAIGTPIADLDLLIASQAIAAGMPLVTRNVGDMARTGADIINPWT